MLSFKMVPHAISIRAKGIINIFKPEIINDINVNSKINNKNNVKNDRSILLNSSINFSIGHVNYKFFV